jgi:GGDEF domain-containing protein
VTDPITILLALASPLRRASLRSSLVRAPGIWLVGEAAAAAAVVEQLPVCRPHILIVDHDLLADPAVAALLARRDPQAATPDLSSAVALPFTLSPAEWTAELRRILAPAAAPETPVEVPPDLRQRYHFSGPPEGSTPRPRLSPATSRPPSRPALGRRRALESRQVQLAARLRALQQQKDMVTGLAAPQALEQAWALLPPARQPVALLAVKVRDEHGTARAPSFTLLRRLSATLRANVRQDDFVCRAGPATFVIVLPGMRREETAIPTDRLEMALEETCRRQAAAVGARLTIESTYWEAESLAATAFLRRLQTLQRGSGPLFAADC